MWLGPAEERRGAGVNMRCDMKKVMHEYGNRNLNEKLVCPLVEKMMQEDVRKCKLSSESDLCLCFPSD